MHQQLFYKQGLFVLTGIFGVFCLFLFNSNAQVTLSTSHGRNYIEGNVNPYILPDPLVSKDGRRIIDVESWLGIRRDEILRDFSDLMYGHTPELPVTLHTKIVAIRKDAVNGLATRMLVTLRFFDDPNAPHINLMLYVPNKACSHFPRAKFLR